MSHQPTLHAQTEHLNSLAIKRSSCHGSVTLNPQASQPEAVQMLQMPTVREDISRSPHPAKSAAGT